MKTIAFLASTALAATLARADPIDPTRVPADAKYVLHVDMDALRPTKLWAAINDRLVGNEAFGTKMGLFEQGSGMHFPHDLHAITIYGRAVGDEAAVVVVRAKMNRAQFMAAIQFADNYAGDSYGKYDVASWDDDKRALYCAFHDDATLIFARSLDNLKSALDVMDGKLPAVAPTDPLAAGAKQPALVYVALADLQSTAGNAPNPLVKQIDGGWLNVNERRAAATRPTTEPASPDAVVHVVLTAKSADAAQQLLQAATGLRAMVAMAAAAGNADPKIQFAAAVLRPLTLGQAGKDVSADVAVPVDQLEQFADRAAAEPPKAEER
jgi:hypothetical protein